MPVPRGLSIAGSDSGGGAGIQADLKAFARAGCHGMTVVVALTAQNPLAVTAVHEVPPEFVRAQLNAVFSDIGVDAAKTGMLFSRAIIEAVAGFLAEHPVPLVVDPVMVASSGAKLLQEDAVESLVGAALPAGDRGDAGRAGGRGSDGMRRCFPGRACGGRARAGRACGGRDGRARATAGGRPLRRAGVPAHPGRAARPADHPGGRLHPLRDSGRVPRPRAQSRGGGIRAAYVASEAVAHGLEEIGAGEGPVVALG